MTCMKAALRAGLAWPEKRCSRIDLGFYAESE